MSYIRRYSTIPVPKVHHYDTTTQNPIGCPYICMNCVDGVYLYNAWFQDGSESCREQFRARALQSLATNMVQLNKFRFPTGGAIKFDYEGKPVEAEGARIYDTLHQWDQGAHAGRIDDSSDCSGCSEEGRNSDWHERIQSLEVPHTSNVKAFL